MGIYIYIILDSENSQENLTKPLESQFDRAWGYL